MKGGMGIVPAIVICAAAALTGGCGGPDIGEPVKLAGRQAPEGDVPVESAAPSDLADLAPRAEPVAQVPEPEPAPVPVSSGLSMRVASTNLLENGSFDQPAAPTGDVPYWRLPGSVTARLDAESYDGPWALGVELAGNQNFGAPQTVREVKAGAYLIRGYLRTRELDGGARLEVQDADGGFKSFVAFTDSVEGTRDWTLVSK